MTSGDASSPCFSVCKSFICSAEIRLHGPISFLHRAGLGF